MIRLYIVFSVFAVFLWSSCTQGDRQQAIEERERAVALREEQIATSETDYQDLLQMRDSLAAARERLSDSVSADRHWPEMLQGDWNSRMVCRVPGCATYVIGDQRNELWRFQVDTTGTAYVLVISNDTELRRFRGSYDGHQVTLSLVTDSATATDVRFHRRALLDNIGTRLVKGTQYMVDHNNCETVFSVELTPREI